MENNPFKNIAHPPHEVPIKLKSKVMTHIARLRMLADLTTLFTYNFSNTAKTIFKKK